MGGFFLINYPTVYATGTTGIGEGLDYLLTHFKEQEFWPRTISTKTTEGKQITVNSKEEALARFTQAKMLDCRISAYPPNAVENSSPTARFQGFSSVTPRTLIVMIDLDRCNFVTDRALGQALTRTLHTIKDKLDPLAVPSVIWSGRGYHVYLVLDSNNVNLEYEQVFTSLTNEPTRKFLQFAEHYLSNGKSDKSHNNTMSFNNCMIRVPGSINSKNGQTVRIIQKWNGSDKPAINYLLSDFCVYLANEKAQEILQLKQRLSNMSRHDMSSSVVEPSSIHWIEDLLQTPLKDHRKYCIWRILAPYLLNIKKVSEHEAYVTIEEWLQRCSQLNRLDFNVKQRINDGLDSAVKRGYLPISLEKLKEENPQLYQTIR